MHILLRLPVQFAWWFTKYWCLGWLAYYVVTDGNRRLIIRSRERMLQAILTDLKDHPPQPDNIALSNGNGNGEGHGSASEDDASVNGVSRDEKEALKRRFGSLRCLGRYWNPFVEWREQGAWVSGFFTHPICDHPSRPYHAELSSFCHLRPTGSCRSSNLFGTHPEDLPKKSQSSGSPTDRRSENGGAGLGQTFRRQFGDRGQRRDDVHLGQ